MGVVNPRQRLLGLTPESEPRLYHDISKYGYFALLQRNPRTGGKRQTMHRLTDMPHVLRACDKTRDTWLSMSQFYRQKRRLACFWRTGAGWADLDLYKTKYSHLGPEHQLELLQEHCAGANIISPSLVVFSGRGLQAKWLFDCPIPGPALIRWDAVQRELIKKFEPLGADAACRPATTVLRLITTVNTKSGERVRVLWPPPGQDPTVWGFDTLADELLPYTRAEIQQMKAEARAKRKRKGKVVGKWSLRLDARQLNLDRYHDVVKLLGLRGWAEPGAAIGSGVPRGYRNHVVWVMTAFLAWSLEPPYLGAEARTLATTYCPSLTANEVRGTIGTTLRRAYEAFSGEVGSYKGKPVDRRYRFSNQRLLDLLEITPGEEQHLNTIISKTEARRRKRVRDEQRRRDRGQRPWLEHAQSRRQRATERRAEARELVGQGRSVAEVAQRLGVTPNTVYVYLRTAEGNYFD